jgi:hypothetical protein
VKIVTEEPDPPIPLNGSTGGHHHRRTRSAFSLEWIDGRTSRRNGPSRAELGCPARGRTKHRERDDGATLASSVVAQHCREHEVRNAVRDGVAKIHFLLLGSDSMLPNSAGFSTQLGNPVNLAGSH